MILCKYAKTDRAIFVPHLDTLRAFIMGMRRCGIRVRYSEGFNPHMQLFFNQPLPIGTASECEYFCAYSDEDPSRFCLDLNESLPQGLRVLRAGRVDVDPNVAKIMCFADYSVCMRDIVPGISAKLQQILAADSYTIDYAAKGKAQSKDVRQQILSLACTQDRTVTMRLTCGNSNLRADRLMHNILREVGFTGGFTVTKHAMYDKSGMDLDTICFKDNDR